MNLTHKLVKYFFTIILLVAVLYYIPTNKLDVYDSITIIIVVIAFQFSLDYLCDAKISCDCSHKRRRYNDEPFENVGENKDELTRLYTYRQKSDDPNKYNDSAHISAPKYADRRKYNFVQNPNVENEMPYDQLGFAMHDPMGELYNPNRRTFRTRKYKGEYGDWYMPPEEWYPVCSKPPPCMSKNGCPVQPVYTSGSQVDLRDFDELRKVMQDNISIPYVRQLNSIDYPTTNKDVDLLLQKNKFSSD